MSLEEFKLWLAIGGSGAGLAIGLYNFFRQPSRDNSNKIEELANEIQKVSRRVDHIETQLGHMPTKDEFSDLRLAVANTNGELKGISSTMKALNHTVQNIDEALRKGK